MTIILSLKLIWSLSSALLWAKFNKFLFMYPLSFNSSFTVTIFDLQIDFRCKPTRKPLFYGRHFVFAVEKSDLVEHMYRWRWVQERLGESIDRQHTKEDRTTNKGRWERSAHSCKDYRSSILVHGTKEKKEWSINQQFLLIL